MSKNHPHDNMYSILGKLAALKPTPEEKRFALVKEIRESVEAKGSVLQGVDAVQARLAKQFAESNTNEAVRVVGNTKGPVGHYSHMKYADKDGSPESKKHRDDTAAMARSARAAGSKLPFNKTTEPSGKLASGGYNAMTKGVTPVKMSEGHCSKCDCEPCKCPTNESKCNECGMYENKCSCDHTNEGFPAIQAARKKYGDKGLEALRDKKAAGASKETMQATRNKFDKYNEGLGDMARYIVTYTDNKKPEQKRTTEVKATSVADAKRAFADWNDSNRFTFVSAKSKIDESVMEDIQADDGDHYRSFDDFIGQFPPDSFDDTEEREDGMEISGYVGDQCVMVWKYDDESMTSGWGNYDSQILEGAEHRGLVAGKFYLVSDYGNGVGSQVFNSYDEANRARDSLSGRARDEYYVAQFDGKNLNSYDGSEEDLPEGEITRKPGVTTHRKTEFPGYPTDDGDDVEDANKGKRGRPRKHAIKAPKTDAEGNRLGRGRPAKVKAPTYTKMADPFGRTTGAVPKPKTKGRVHSMDEAMDTLGQKLSRINESVNFKRMMEEQHMTLDEMIECMTADMQQFKESGICSERLRDMMEVYAHAKKQMEETIDPTNPRDYEIPAYLRKQQGQEPLTARDVMQKDKKAEHDFYQRRTGEPHPDALKTELDELAKLAGLSEVSRGEYIKQQDTAAEKSGKHKFQAFGQEFDTDEITEEPNEGNTFTKGLEDDNVEIGDKIPGTNAIKKVDIDESIGSAEDAINISTNMSSNGDKNVTVTANGSQAAELLQMLRIAGLGGGAKAQELQAEPDLGYEEPGIQVIDIEPEQEVDEAGVGVDQPAVDPVNAPDPQYASMRGSTMGPGEGDSGEKAMNPDRPTKNNGDNALATPPTRAQKTLIAVSALESKLAAEYESIKKLS
jgi:hypothetical protein